MALNPIDDDYINSIIKSSGPYNPALNKTQGVKLRELIKLLRDQIQEGGGGQSGPQPVTYAQLMDLVNGNLLVPAKKYLITDFASRFSKFTLYQDVTTGVSSFNINYSQETRYSGPTEPIVVTAQTTNTISDRADSTIYPNHLLNYTLNNLTTGVTASDKGTILRRIDLVRNVNINFDFMAMKCFLQSSDSTVITERLSILIENCYNFYGNFTSWYGDVNACYITNSLRNSRFESDMYGTGISIGAMADSIVNITNSLIICPNLLLGKCEIFSPVNLVKSNGVVRRLLLNLTINKNSNTANVVSDTSIEPFLNRAPTEKSAYTSSTGAYYLRTIGPDGNYVVTPFVP